MLILGPQNRHNKQKMYCNVIVIALLISTVWAKYQCINHQTLHYDYASEIESFGGTGTDRNEDTQTTVLSARLSLSCLTQVGHNEFLYVMKLAKVQVDSLPPRNTKKWKRVREHETRDTSYLAKHMDKYFHRPIAFIMTNEGKLVKMFSDKNDKVWVKQTKTSIVSMFVTKLHGQFRFMEQGTLGMHT
jgi:hypothetical protein